jgi:hypothetical protein
MTGAWIRNISPRTNFTAAATSQWFTSDAPNNFASFDATNTESFIQTLTGQIDTELSSQLRFMARAGGGVIHTTEEFSPSFAGGNYSDTSGNFVGATALVYELKNTLLSASASHGFAPSSLGEVQDRTQVGLGVDHKINEWSNILFETQYFNQSPSISTPGEAEHRQALIFSVAYGRNLMRDWDMILRYRLITQDESADLFVPFEDGSSVSNAVFLTVTRDLHFSK